MDAMVEQLDQEVVVRVSTGDCQVVVKKNALPDTKIPLNDAA
jgi:hypothetical protein